MNTQNRVYTQNKEIENLGSPLIPMFGFTLLFWILLLLLIIMFWNEFWIILSPLFLLTTFFLIFFSLYIIGIVIGKSVIYYVQQDMKKLSGNIDNIVRGIERIGEEDSIPSEFKFQKVTVIFKFPFMRLETELIRRKEG